MNNIEKILQYLQMVAKEPIYVDGKIYDKCNSIHRIQLSKTFFLSDSCESCGCCDVPEDNVYVQFEYDKIMSISEKEYHSYNSDLDIKQLFRLRDGLIKKFHVINGKTIPIYVFKLESRRLYLSQKGRYVDRCTWAFNPNGDEYADKESCTKYYCNIHPVTSITCKMPHLRFLNTSKSDILRIGIYQFGRNWATRCPVVFKEPLDEAAYRINKENRIYKLRYLLDVSNDLNIETYLPEIIDYVENIEYGDHVHHLEKDIVCKNKSAKKLVTIQNQNLL